MALSDLMSASAQLGAIVPCASYGPRYVADATRRPGELNTAFASPLLKTTMSFVGPLRKLS